jgi:hypothetical protein
MNTKRVYKRRIGAEVILSFRNRVIEDKKKKRRLRCKEKIETAKEILWSFLGGS